MDELTEATVPGKSVDKMNIRRNYSRVTKSKLCFYPTEFNVDKTQKASNEVEDVLLMLKTN